MNKFEEDKRVKLQSELAFNGSSEFDTFSILRFKQLRLLFNKPIYVGFTILEVSKLLMYQAYYDTPQPYSGERNIQLHYQDADSFVISVKTNDIIQDLKQHKNLFDFSNLPEDHELYNPKFKKVMGRFTIETPKSVWLDKFISLKSKMYALQEGGDRLLAESPKASACSDRPKDESPKVSERIKGISKAMSKTISFDVYERSLFGDSNCCLRNSKHEMFLEKINKALLNPFDNKRYYKNENLPFGYST